MSQSLYHKACCIDPPEEPCNLCRSGSTYYNMNSDAVVTYNGEASTCLEVYASLILRSEQSSEHCISAQRELFSICCDANTGLTVSDDSTSATRTDNNISNNISQQPHDIATHDRAPSPSSLQGPNTNAPTLKFNTWYAGGLSPAVIPVISFGSIGLVTVAFVLVM